MKFCKKGKALPHLYSLAHSCDSNRVYLWIDWDPPVAAIEGILGIAGNGSPALIGKRCFLGGGCSEWNLEARGFSYANLLAFSSHLSKIRPSHFKAVVEITLK